MVYPPPFSAKGSRFEVHFSRKRPKIRTLLILASLQNSKREPFEFILFLLGFNYEPLHRQRPQNANPLSSRNDENNKLRTIRPKRKKNSNAAWLCGAQNPNLEPFAPNATEVPNPANSIQIKFTSKISNPDAPNEDLNFGRAPKS